jgi:hypothetical protein
LFGSRFAAAGPESAADTARHDGDISVWVHVAVKF